MNNFINEYAVHDLTPWRSYTLISSLYINVYKNQHTKFHGLFVQTQTMMTEQDK